MRVEDFAECGMVNVALPLQGQQTLQTDGVLRLLDPPHLEIQFPASSLPIDRLDLNGRWRITFDKGVAFLTVWAVLSRVSSSTNLHLHITHSEISTHTRRDHRIDTEIYLRYWTGGENRQKNKPRRTSVNLSGYGISFRTEKAFSPGSLVEMELTLPGATLETIRCLGRVIRTVGKTPEHFTTAFELVNVSEDDLEKVIHFSMTEQFKSMRNKARILAETFQPGAENAPE